MKAARSTKTVLQHQRKQEFC